MNLRENINKRIEGQFTLYNVDSAFSEEFQREFNELTKNQYTVENFISNKLKDLSPAALIKNQILQNGLRIFNRNLSSVSRIVAGYVTGSVIPSTFSSQQSLQAPLDNLKFNRVGGWEELTLPNGFKYTYSFVRPAGSEGGSTINEMSVQVVDGVNVANLNRVWAPNNGLPYTFPPDQDTLAIFELTQTVS